MTEVPINQKEYLKKYLGIGKAPGEKKRKKKKSGTVNRVQIIDDDADVNIPTVTIKDDVDEDAPQIVAIIDERPPSLRIDEKTQNPMWRPIGTVDDVNPSGQKQAITGFKITPKVIEKVMQFDRSPPRRKKVMTERLPPRKSRFDDPSPREELDKSPPRRKNRKSRFDDSPPKEIVIKQERRSEPRFEDNSPARRNRDGDVSPPRIIKVEDDNSPPRRGKGDSDGNKSQTSNDASSPRRTKYEVNSPQRRSKSQISDDNSPPRRHRREDDNSPPRKRKEIEVDRNKSHSKHNYSPRNSKGNVRDNSPQRSRETSTSRSRSESKHGDNSPPRRKKYADDDSPPKRRRTPDNSPGKSQREDKDKTDEKRKKMVKTLDGKSAGLQNARELIEETRSFKNREDTMFKSLSKDVSGEQAETVHRDRRTGKIRNLEEEVERKRKKQEEEEKNKEKYARWGRGLAQVENREQQLQEQLHEMSKPLARYADDEDLERYLKEQEREGDPMLAYIRKKKRKKAAEAGEVFKPQFEGEFMPNRYGIRPGHRWDGVDRSSGYENKWFEVQNQRTALQEDSYKWSTEDM